MLTFESYGLKLRTQQFITANKFINPTPIQQAVIPLARKGKDIIGISRTGTGKSHAFFIPIMERLDFAQPVTQVIISAPTRELATQLFNRAKVMMDIEPSLKILLMTGGIERSKMAEQMKIPPQIIIGTPGRIKDLVINNQLRVDKVKMVVVDEADMTLEFGFLEDLDQVISRMDANVQMMVFGATIPNQLQPFLKKYMKSPQLINVEGEHHHNPKIEHILVPCKHKSYVETLIDILPGFQPFVCLIFANTRQDAADCAAELRQHQVPVIELHGDLSPRQRRQALKQLESQDHSYVVASDIAARGIDIDAVTHVVSLGFPKDLDYYVHRSGRTGRAGRDGVCYALMKTSDEQSVQALKSRGITFVTKVFKTGQWRELKMVKRVTKNDTVEKEIAKVVHRKNQVVKPGYKKKRQAEIDKIKRKQKRAMIDASIQTVRKEKYKAAQRAKRDTE